MQLESHSKLDVVHQTIEKRILDGCWKIGDQIPTEDKLALEFGCSRGTVSKAVARLTHDGLVQRRTRAGTRVLGSSVKRLKAQIHLDACAFIYPNEQHEGIRRIVHGFQDAAGEVKRRVVTLTTGTDFRKEAEIIGRLGEFDVKGAVVYPVLPEVEDRLYFEQMLRKCSFPVVVADIALPGVSCPCVTVDSFDAGYTLTQHLLGQGLRRIGFLAGYAWLPAVRDCYQGYQRALEAADIVKQPGWVLLETSMHPNFQEPVVEGVPLAKRFLENAGELEAVVCANDFQALGCLAAARELGIRVPEELKVVGVSDYAIASRSEPPLTTYRVPWEKLGRQALQMLERLLRGEKLSTMELQIRGDIVVRQSG